MVLQRALKKMSRYDKLLDAAMRKYSGAPLNSARKKLADKRINQMSLRRMQEVDRLVIGELPASKETKQAALRVLAHKLLLTDLNANIVTNIRVKKTHLLELIEHAKREMDSIPVQERAKFEITPEAYSFLNEQRAFLVSLKKEDLVPKPKLVDVLRGVDNAKLHLILGDANFGQYEKVLNEMIRIRHGPDKRLIQSISMN